MMRPAQEVPQLQASWMLVQPPVDIDLREVGQSEVLVVEPGEEGGGAADGLAHSCGAGWCKARSGRSASGLAQDRPLRVDAQHVAVLRGNLGEAALQPGLQMSS